MLLGNLRSDSDISIQQAIDELYIHHLLSRRYQAAYEEDTKSPDFRLYRAENEFPDDVLEPTFRFVARHNETGIRMDWEPSFPNQ